MAEKSFKKEQCAGEYKVNDQGEITYCSKGYYLNQSGYKQSERAYTLAEKVGNYFRSLAGWSFWIIIALIILCPSLLGGLIGWFLNHLFGGTSKVAKALISGIANGKKYIRENGTKYTLEEKVIYQKGADDLLKAIDEAIDDKEVEKLIYKIRADLKWDK